VDESKVKDIVIIGGSAAGITAANKIVEKDKKINVTVINSENKFPYYRPLISKYLFDTGVTEKRIFYLKSSEWYEENINLLLRTKVESINSSDFTLLTDKKKKINFDRLIISTGSSPFVPIKGALENRNAFTLRYFADAEDIRKYSETAEKAAVIGGGLLGLEIAFSLMKNGLEVTIIELAERLLPIQLDRKTSAFLEALIKNTGIEIYTGVSVDSLTTKGKAITSLALNTGIDIQVDMAIFSIGTKPNKDIAENILEIDRGIIVNEKMETSISGIYACGDVAQYDYTPGLWMPALKQGSIAGDNATGGNSVFMKENYPALLNSFGTRIFSIGNISENSENYFNRSYGDFSKGSYMKLFFCEEKTNGGIIVGNISKSQLLAKCVNSSMNINDTLKLLKIEGEEKKNVFRIFKKH